MSTHRPAGHMSPDAPPAAPTTRDWVVLALLCIAQFMLVLDVTAANIALPSIASDLRLGTSDLTWVITAYAVTFGGLMLLGGRLADVLGRRRLLVTGLVLFTVSSALCGLALDGVQLIAGRAVQGVGAALLSPAALASVSTLFTGAARTRALGVWAGIGASGFAVGLLASGLLTSGPGWRWIFLVNVPIGVALIPLLLRMLPASSGIGGRIDLVGGLLATVFAAALVVALGGLGGLGDAAGGLASWWPITLALGVAVLALVLFVLQERCHPAPLVPLGVLRRRPVMTGLALMLLASAAMLSLFFLASMYLQQVVGLDPFQTGLVFLPSAVATVISAHLASRALARFSVRLVAAGAFAITAAGGLVLTQLDGSSALWYPLIAGLVLVSFGLGPAFLTATASALARVDVHEAGLASGIVNTGHEIGGAFGVAAVASVIGAASASLLDPGAYARGFAALAIAALAAAIVSLVFIAPGRIDSSALPEGPLH
ncbi:MFS transporter [Microbacterium immunditiarum]|uniref:EmrB/QacA subfamily drug resistance transporter n=1 Tax=Microbacterium immunditiarum TaxID=337480 RepID=A0A7Y9GNV7_9MICO|nr:EmrB/QacA subfamily drug resistance transporter [Microbacterium immunditiarum]